MVVFQTDLRGNSSNQHYKSPLPVVVTLGFLVLLCQHIEKKSLIKLLKLPLYRDINSPKSHGLGLPYSVENRSKNSSPSK